MSRRTPYNGQPFYCELCGAGFYEYVACEMPDCKLESPEAAEKRRDEHNAQSPGEDS